MSDPIRRFAIVGLGKMGGGLALNAMEKGFEVCGVDSHAVSGELTKAGLKVAGDFEALAAQLPRPRFVMLYVPAGPPVDDILGQLSQVLEPGDIIADGGNSYWGDSIRRHARLKDKGLHFIDAGTSGGPSGARNGACFMIGGEAGPVAAIEPILRKLAVAGGYVHAGKSGAGHFVKLVHNGIEFGMNHAIGDGVELLRHGGFDLDMEAIFKNWSHGSVIRGWLVELFAEGLEKEKFDAIPPYVEDTGEVNWLVQVAVDKEIAIPTISLAVQLLFMSRGSGEDCARAVALLRHGYGGHPFGKDARIVKERKTSRLTKI